MIKNFKSWLIAAAIRAAKTFAQTFLSAIPMGAAFLGSVNWGLVLSSSALAAVLSFVTSIKGLPEVGTDKVSDDNVPKEE